MKKSSNAIFLILLFAISACERESELFIPSPSSKLVVNSLLEANMPIQVYVGASTYAMDTVRALHITNALITVTSDDFEGTDTLRYHKNGIYISESKIAMAEKTYFTEVVTANFEKVSASAYVPPTVQFSDYTFKPDAGIGKNGELNKLLTVTIPDNDDRDDYYMLLLIWYSQDSSSISPRGYISNVAWYSYSLIIMAEGGEEEKIFSDELFNGQNAVIPMNFHTWWAWYFDDYDLKFTLKCYLITLSEDYYNYHKSYLRYQEAGDNIWLANSPPKLMSNVENAFGIFAGINISDSIVFNF